MRDWFKRRIIGITFNWNTIIRPLFSYKYYGYAYDWAEKCVSHCWWIKDIRGKWIPWAHFDNGTITYCTPDNAFDLMGKDVIEVVNE